MDVRINPVSDFVDGYINNPNNQGFAAKNPLQALELVEKLTSDSPALFILKDFNKFLQDISISRKLRNLMRTFKKQPKSIIILASEVDIPPELADLITVVEFSLPNAIEIRNELIRLFDTLKQPFEEDSLDLLVRSCQELSNGPRPSAASPPSHGPSSHVRNLVN